MLALVVCWQSWAGAAEPLLRAPTAWQCCFLCHGASDPGGIPCPAGTARRKKGAEPDPAPHFVFGSKNSCCLGRLFPGAGRGERGWKQPEDGAGPAAPLSPRCSHGKAAVLTGTVCTRIPALLRLVLQHCSSSEVVMIALVEGWVCGGTQGGSPSQGSSWRWLSLSSIVRTSLTASVRTRPPVLGAPGERELLAP